MPAGYYYITREGANEDDAATGDFDITNSMTIIGEGMDATIINALGEVFGLHDRVFHVNAQYGNVNFQDLGIYGGYVSAAENDIDSGGGVLITNAHNVNFLRCHFHSNYAQGNGGAIYAGPDLLFNTNLTITESLIDMNRSVK